MTIKTNTDLKNKVLEHESILSTSVKYEDYDSFKTSTNASLAEKATKTELNAVASGSPKGTYATLTDLQTAFPTGNTNIYLVTATGNWYYWNGSAWTSGGTYQSTGIADKGVIPSKTTFAKEPNLFDFSKATKGQFVNGSGNLQANVDYYVSDYIEIEPSTVYSKTYTNFYSFYDLNKTYISGKNYDGVNPLTTPSNAKYIRISCHKDNFDSFMLQKGSFNTEYISYSTTPKFNDPLMEKQVLNKHLTDKCVKTINTEFMDVGYNLFNKVACTVGKFIVGSTGNLQINANYMASDYIEIKPLTYYSKNNSNYFAFYDLNKTYISGYDNPGLTTFKTPFNAKYVRISALLSEVDTLILNEGQTLLAYQDYIEIGKLKSSCAPYITSKNAEFMDYSYNLFDKDNVTLGKFVLGTDGTLLDNSTWAASDYIEIEPNKVYTKTTPNHFAFYDVNKVYISGYTTNGVTLFNAPSNAKYIRVSVVKTDLPIFQLTQSVVTLPYKSYAKYGKLKTECMTNTINSKMIVTNWKDKLLATLGDSITYQATWQPYITSFFCMAYNNYGIGGTKVADTTGSDTQAMCRDERINAIDINSNVITFMGGTNDWAGNVPLGTLGSTDTTTFYGALNVLFTKLITRFPTSRILAMGTPYGKYADRSNFTDKYGLKNDQGLMTIDYGKAIGEVARIYGIPFVDIGASAGWNDINIATYVQYDGAYLHPNDLGGQRIAGLVIGKLKSIEPVS